MQETKRAGRFSAPALVSVYRVDLLNGFGSLVSRNAQRPKETAIVCCDFQRATWLHDTRRRRNFRQCLRLRTVHESDDSFKRDLHLEAGGPRLLAARFDLWIVRNRGCDCVGQFPREPVHDVVHPYPPYAAGPGSGALPDPYTKQIYGDGPTTLVSN